MTDQKLDTSYADADAASSIKDTPVKVWAKVETVLREYATDPASTKVTMVSEAIADALRHPATSDQDHESNIEMLDVALTEFFDLIDTRRESLTTAAASA